MIRWLIAIIACVLPEIALGGSSLLLGSGNYVPAAAAAAGFTSLQTNTDFTTSTHVSSTGPWYNPGVWYFTGTNTAPFLSGGATNLPWTVGDRAGGSVIGTMKPNGLVTTSWKYGYFEVNAAFGAVSGQWPAWWMEGNTATTDYTSIPNTNHNYFELDGLEWLSNQSTSYLGTIHAWQGTTPTDVQNNDSANATTFPAGYNLSNYNTYGWSWTATQICWYFNNKLMHCANSTTYPTAFASANAQPMYLILENSVSSPAPTGNTNVAIHWVRVWQ